MLNKITFIKMLLEWIREDIKDQKQDAHYDELDHHLSYAIINCEFEESRIKSLSSYDLPLPTQETLHDGTVIKVGDRINQGTYGRGTVVSFGTLDPNRIYTIDTQLDDGRKMSFWRADTSISKVINE